MAKRLLPTPDQLRQLLRYDADSGNLYWRERGAQWFSDRHRDATGNANNWNARYAGKQAGYLAPVGYRYVALPNGSRVSEHRVIWAMTHDAWPKVIDHMDGDKTNNRLSNLRSVSQTENLRNAKRWSHNTSGVTGVCLEGRSGKWLATIKVNQRAIHLGLRETFDEAVELRREAERRFGFTARHGS